MTAVVFTRAGFLRGAGIAVPLSVGMIPFGVVAGVLAETKGLTLLEALLMSATVFAGASQLVALESWSDPAPVLAAGMAAFVVNLRMALMGPVLAPWFDRLHGWRRWVTLGVMVDHGFALSATEMRSGRNDAAFLFGVGAMLWLMWLVQTAAGHILGTVARFPAGHPLYFGATAAFITLMVPMWRGLVDAVPWAVAGVAAVAVTQALPGTAWHVVVGAVAGAIAGAMRDRPSSPSSRSAN
jgi:4-azaleucine resistance transporter AzlC